MAKTVNEVVIEAIITGVNQVVNSMSDEKIFETLSPNRYHHNKDVMEIRDKIVDRIDERETEVKDKRNNQILVSTDNGYYRVTVTPIADYKIESGNWTIDIPTDYKVQLDKAKIESYRKIAKVKMAKQYSERVKNSVIEKISG